MHIRFRVFAIVLLAMIVPTLFSRHSMAAHQKAPTQEFQQAPPFLFVENAGQLAAPVRYQLALGSIALTLTDDGLWLRNGAAQQPNISSTADTPGYIHLSFPDANTHPRLEGFQPLPTRMAYFLGNTPEHWYTRVPVWGGVRYRDLYPGIDLEITSLAGDLDLRIVVQPGARPDLVRMQAHGAERVTTDARFIRLGTMAGELRLPLLRLAGTDVRHLLGRWAYPRIQGTQILMPFAQAELAATSGLAATPANLEYSSFFGTNGTDQGDAIATDHSGAAYIGGWTDSSNFPGEIFGSNESGIDAVVMKLAPTAGAVPSYIVVVGGKYPDYISGIAVDDSGAAYAVGFTASANFPTTSGAFDRATSGISSDNRQIFVLRLDSAGSTLTYSTYIGGRADERGFEIDVDNEGMAYITGRTTSNDFPLRNAYDSAYSGGYDAFALKLNATGSDLMYSTYLGGSANDQGNDITVADDKSAYITGYTGSVDFPRSNGYDLAHNGLEDVFVVRLDAAGDTLLYGTFIGGSKLDRGNSIVLDAAGAAYVAGYSTSDDFPGANRTRNDMKDAIVFKLAPSGAVLEYVTAIDGLGDEAAEAVAVDDRGEAFVTGTTRLYSLNPDPDKIPPGDVFVIKLDAQGQNRIYSAFFGGGGDDSADGMALDPNGAALITGYASYDETSPFPTTDGALDASHNGDDDIILMKFVLADAPPAVYAISGQITDQQQPLANVVVRTNTGKSATSDANGFYRLIGLDPGSYTVTPERSGYSFQPASRSATIIDQDLAGMNFSVAAASVYSLSGRVLDSRTSQGLAGVTISLSNNRSTVSDTNGRYSFTDLPKDNYTVTPALASYTFSPPWIELTLEANTTVQTFRATRQVQYATFVSQVKDRLCDVYEPNGDRYGDLVHSQLFSGQRISAKICSSEDRSASGVAVDHYEFTINQPQSVNLLVTLPPSYRGYTVITVYHAQTEESLSKPICVASQIATPIWRGAECAGKFDAPGRYILRIYLGEITSSETYGILATYR